MSTAIILFFACFAPLFVCLPLLWLFDRYAFNAYPANVLAILVCILVSMFTTCGIIYAIN